MPTYIFGDSENLSFDPIEPGDYPFEIGSVTEGIQRGGKTGGSDTLVLQLRVYKDATFTQQVAQWSETLIFHPSCFWKIDTFLKCVGYPVPAKGEELQVSANALSGMRGWCLVGVQKGTQNPDRVFNRVSVWYTDRDKLTPHRIDVSDLPPAAPSVAGANAEDDLPW